MQLRHLPPPLSQSRSCGPAQARRRSGAALPPRAETGDRSNPLQRWAAALLVLVLVAAGCSPYQVRSLNRPEVPVSNTYHHALDGERVIGQWWQEFNNPALNTTVASALDNSLDLRQLWSRLAQAYAQARIEGAEVFPWVDLGGGAARTHQVDRDPRDPFSGRAGSSTRITHTDRYFVSTGLSYEIDVWQRIAARRRAATLEYQASRQDLEASALLLTGSVVDAWFILQEQKALLALLQEQIEISQELLDLTEVRFGVGAGSAVDVLQQRQQLEATRAEIPIVRSRLNTAYNQLAVLLGTTPGALDTRIPDGVLPDLPPFPQLGEPATLLVSRPDLRAAQLRLQAADFRVATAVAERLPRLVLDLSYEFSARSFSTVFRQEVGSLVGNLVAPVIDGGLRRNQVVRHKALTQELLDRFGQQYLQALLEIEDALVRERFQVELIANLESQIGLARSTLRESQSRYVNGLINYVTVLLAVQSLQGLQRRLISEKRFLLSNRAGLYRALGGHWTSELTAPPSLQLAQVSAARIRP